MKLRKRIVKTVLAVIIVMVVTLAAFLGTVAITDYRPGAQTPLKLVTSGSNQSLATQTTYRLLTFNTGYAALGKDENFFMDGGTAAGAQSVEEVQINLAAINQVIKQYDPDFAFLQEVDEKAQRSKNINQLTVYQQNNLNMSFAINYKTLYVPIPVTHPMGGVVSGLVTLSKALPTSAVRYSFDGKESAIIQLFELDRCFAVSRYTVNDRELVLINAHFSAFDKGGKIRKLQLAQIKTFLQNEAAKGNYVILGGDFNHELPKTDSSRFTWTDAYPDWCQKFPADFDLSGYSWAVDAQTPSVRSVDHAYVDGENFKAVIDGFLVSDNINIQRVRGLNLNFQNSDHNPVILNFSLKVN